MSDRPTTALCHSTADDVLVRGRSLPRQGAVAAGLLSVGSLFVGIMEGCGLLLARVARAVDGSAEARRVVVEHEAAKKRLPGFGHPVHRPTDPRTTALLSLAEAQDVRGDHCAALDELERGILEVSGRALPPNATGAIAAVLADCGVPVEVLRGIALVSRCAGLVGHIHEEQRRPAMLALWQAAEAAVPYENHEEER